MITIADGEVQRTFMRASRAKRYPQNYFSMKHRFLSGKRSLHPETPLPFR
jgi:hypothetical protein